MEYSGEFWDRVGTQLQIYNDVFVAGPLECYCLLQHLFIVFSLGDEFIHKNWSLLINELINMPIKGNHLTVTSHDEFCQFANGFQLIQR
jgi:hypothetical protein